MSIEYDLYLAEHKENVTKAFRWMQENLPDLIKQCMVPGVDLEHQICFAHDASKSELDEYEAYDAYYYGGNRSYYVCQRYKVAWLKHLHRNPHHWQHWILINDDPEEGTVVLDMPINYIIEMISDWWAFSWKSGNLYGIFDWYEKHKDNMQLSNITRITVDGCLYLIRKKLDESGVEDNE